MVLLSLLVATAHAATGSGLTTVQALRTRLEWSAQQLQLNEAQRESEQEADLVTLPQKTRSAGIPKAATGTLSITVDGAQVELKDVPMQSWFAPFVRTAADAGFLSGYRDAAGKPTGLFGPADPVTLAEIAKMAASAAGIDPSACAKPKNPLAAGWAKPYIGCAEDRHWVLFSEATVNPNRPALRGEVVVTILQALGVQPEEIKGDTGPFKDVGFSTQYAAAINRAKLDGVVAGYMDANGNPTGRFGPDDKVTRAEAAKILVTAVQKEGN